MFKVLLRVFIPFVILLKKSYCRHAHKSVLRKLLCNVFSVLIAEKSVGLCKPITIHMRIYCNFLV